MSESNAAQIRPPLRGLNSRDIIHGLREDEAIQLNNWITTNDVLSVRPGYLLQSAPALPSNIQSVIYYSNGGQSKSFAAAGTALYDVSGTAAPSVLTGINPEVVEKNFQTAAGAFLFAVDGAGKLLRYNGTSWVVVSDITGAPTRGYQHLEAYKQRMYFLEKSSSTLYYLAAGSISGTMQSFPVGPYLTRGGHLVAIATLTSDGGEGVDDRLVLLSSEGEAVVYTGTDPGDPERWSLVGVYYVGLPVGKRCVTKFGGDLLVMTMQGISSFSRLLTATSPANPAITDVIYPLYRTLTNTYQGLWGWQLVVEPSIPALVCNVPAPGGLQLIYPLKSKAWSTFTGWATNGLSIQQSNTIAGIGTRAVKLFTGTSDNGTVIVASLITAPRRYNRAGDTRLTLYRNFFQHSGAASTRTAFPHNLATTNLAATLTAAVSGAVWDTALWNNAFWVSGDAFQRNWENTQAEIGREHSLALEVTLTSGTLNWLETDLLWQRAALVRSS